MYCDYDAKIIEGVNRTLKEVISSSQWNIEYILSKINLAIVLQGSVSRGAT